MKKHFLITILTFFLASPLAWADDIYYNIMQEFSVSKIQTDLQAIITNASSDDNIVVTGSKTNADATLTLSIAAGKKVVWQAVYQAVSTFTPNTLIMFLGDGTFEVAGGTLTSPDAMTINSSGTNATVVVSSGTVSAHKENAILMQGAKAKAIISGGVISNTSQGSYPAIYMEKDNNTGLNVMVSGTAKIETEGAYCIYTFGSVIISEDAQVSSPQITSPYYAAIICGALEIKDNAKFSGNIGRGNWPIDNVTVSDNAKVDGNIYADRAFVKNKSKVNGSIEAVLSVEITDYAQIISTSYCAIDKQWWWDESEVTVSGGLVFAHNSSYILVICGTDSITITETGMLLAWNSNAGNREYKMFDTKDISKFPATATAYWDRKGEEFGISYANGDNTGFIPLEVNVLPVHEPVSLEFAVYPNPTNGELTIDNVQLTMNNVEVFDIYGRKQNVEFHSYGLTVLRSYGLTNLPAGVYFLKVGNEVKKVVKL